MPAYEFEGLVPVVDPTAFVHPTAVLVGDVHIGPHAFVGPLATVRGDFGRIEVREGANFQDSCVFHSFPGAVAVLDRDGHVGHGAVLHGCHVGVGVLIGMNAVVMDRAVIGEYAFVAAHSVVPEGFEVPPRTLARGIPAKVTRDLSDAELAWKANGTKVYQDLGVRYRATMREVTPLPAAEPDRPTLPGDESTSVPLGEYRRRTS
ncbi:phenylacetic acid degradation protein PaaY [Virgisporangium ochraceum]|uniref:Phenylacetic acid degradation protein PaaY n=1 Tax=Virgisporangium ochraceum TaxID=65505 RepID=A0A8J3ZRV8_9ACTN|nr:transferase hexapeptide repeat family protein [Virgisporangium ochraceum]GIJ66848.1 phenylacetic acid degradation protein PaaY [Virgisporangium ochraceum]